MLTHVDTRSLGSTESFGENKFVEIYTFVSIFEVGQVIR